MGPRLTRWRSSPRVMKARGCCSVSTLSSQPPAPNSWLLAYQWILEICEANIRDLLLNPKYSHHSYFFAILRPDTINEVHMSWIKKLLPSIRSKGEKKEIPEGLWRKCDECGAMLYRADIEKNLHVCPKCDHHMYISARERLKNFLDEGSCEEIAAEVLPVDRLKFRDRKKYKDRLVSAQKTTGEKDALVVMQGLLCGMPAVACAFEYHFIGGSMGGAVGERFVQAVNASRDKKIPLICFTASGGARMQEALFSLFQMAKTSAALAKLSDKSVPYISVLTNPTMGGVSASLATLGDIIIAEPFALIGFSGPRVIEQTIRHTLPEGFQRSEFLLEHGAIDMICDRRELREKIFKLLSKLTGESDRECQALPAVVQGT